MRMPDPDSPSFQEAYEAAYGVREAKLIAAAISRRKIDKIYNSVKRGLLRARDAAAKKRVKFDLDFDWAQDRLNEQNFCCAITGLGFFREHGSAAKRHPFAPSIDRVIAGGDYTKDNCRIVCHAANVMLFDWGVDVFRITAGALMSIPERDRVREVSLTKSITKCSGSSPLGRTNSN